jgi:hypothetical protein
MSREVKVMRLPVINGKKEWVIEYHTIYTKAEADKQGIKYHEDWRKAFWADEIKIGDYVLSESRPYVTKGDGKRHVRAVKQSKVYPLEVIPVIGISRNSALPVLYLPNGCFAPMSKRPLTGQQFKHRHVLNPDGYRSPKNELYKSHKMTTHESNESYNRAMAMAAFVYMRTGDPIKAYTAAYQTRAFFKSMSFIQKQKYSVGLLNRPVFRRYCMGDFEGLAQMWEDSGEDPSVVIKKAIGMMDREELTVDDFLKLARFVYILHPATVKLVMLAEGKQDLESKLTELPETKPEHLTLEGEISPGQYLPGEQQPSGEVKEDGKNGKRKKPRGKKRVDEVVSEGVSTQ